MARKQRRRVAMAERAQKLARSDAPLKNAASTPAASKLDIGPQSSPSARAAMIR